jgi:uncharacterized protein (TIGR02646 family)
MRTIDKGPEPPGLVAWKRRNRRKRYPDLPDVQRREIRQQALEEQFYLCAYCCQSIADIDDCHNEHVEAQQLSPNRTLDFTNIVASCNTRKQCGAAHKSQVLPLTPLMPECEIELRFKISGRVEGLSERARESIQVLNLGDHERKNRSLVDKRKRISDALLLQNGIDSTDGLEDDELLQMVIDDISKPERGKLEAFAPVVINILRSWMQPPPTSTQPA